MKIYKWDVEIYNVDGMQCQVSAQQPDCLAKIALTCFCKQVELQMFQSANVNVSIKVEDRLC